MNVERLVRLNVRKLTAYVAKEVPCRVKLDANESPFDFSSLLEKLPSIETNRYPDPQGMLLKKTAARRWKTKPGRVLLGNGSDELIYYLITTFGGPVLFPAPTFSMYGLVARALGEKAVGVPLDRGFDLNVERMIRAIRRYSPKLVFLSTPNNPTGNCFSAERVFEIIKASRGLVVIDEAYQPFASRKGMLPLIDEFENLIFMRTLSKVGFAALRVGFLISEEGMINEVNKVRLPFNVNAFSQAVATEAFRNYKDIEETVKVIRKERERLFGFLSETRGIKPSPSEANFILFRVEDASRIWKRLLKRGILVRDLTDVVDNALRVTVGSPEENDLFVRALRDVLE
ncbi:histidinol-phosphate aminotransferase 2 [bacterium BMS3Bbin06]|nr:histidinol-phosphate aminotransferase 2 [bacterium BMS3Abin08]GBE33622.1 histidinol-phosphate aminotransferase 2 [bacterium BMS3Bbin06]HDO35084.1 histidinol-phosphate transaminase [Nitrospirota bacterium]HDY72527.1 histidinol-phosphate transaminase [Nitrospirota bacterium]